MRFDIIITPTASADLRGLRATDRAMIRDALEEHLRFEPQKTGRSRIKRLRDFAHPQYRLRVGEDFRVLYNVTGGTVEIVAVLLKREVGPWLAEEGEPE